MTDAENSGALFGDFPPVSTKEWEEKITADLKGADYAKKLIWKTDEGFDIRPYYRAGDLEGLEYLQSPPAVAPYVRGRRSGRNDWVIRQEIGDEEITIANMKALRAVKSGAGAVGLNVAAIMTHKQMSQLLAGIDLGKTAVHLLKSRSYPLSLELLLYEIADREIENSSVRGLLNFDLIGYLLHHGEFYASLESNLEEAVYLLNTIQKKAPGLRAINVNGHLFQDSGSTLVQELAFALASGNEYLALLTEKGLSADLIAKHLAFTFAVGPNYFLEIAKLRAARLLWSKIVEQYHPEDPSAMEMEIHSRTARWNKTLYDPYVNLLRTTTEGMSAILGNTDTLSVLPFDLAYESSGEFSERIAQNQQMILREESYLDHIVDPASGSYYIETLTHSIAANAWELFKQVGEKGGMIEAVKSGLIQETVAKSAARKKADLAQRKLIQIGTNQYPNTSEEMSDNVGPVSEEKQDKPGTCMTLVPFRVSSGFETLRIATEKFVKNGGKRPEVFLFTFGNLAMLRARAGFVTNFFGCAGYSVLDNPGFSDLNEGVKAAAASGAEIIVLCSSDEEYVQSVPEICKLLRERKPGAHIIVAGFPKDAADQLKAAGVDGFVHVRSNLLETLEEYQKKLGISS